MPVKLHLVIAGCLLVACQGSPEAAANGKEIQSSSKDVAKSSGTVNLKVSDPSSQNEAESECVSITYSLWIGTNVTESYVLTLHPKANSSFYSVMFLAAEVNEHYQFEATVWPYGHYVTSIGGHREDPASYLFWLLYQTPALPSADSPPGDEFLTPVGVDGLFVSDGDHYLFWYRNL